MTFTESQYNIIIGVCAIALALLAYSSELSRSRFLRRIGSLSFKIVVTIVSILVGTWASFEKDNLSADQLSNSLRERDSLTNEQLRKRDSITNSELRRRDSTKYASDLTSQEQIINQQNRIVNLVRDSINQEIPDFGVQATPYAYTFKYDSVSRDLIGNLSLENTGNCPLEVSMFYYIILKYGSRYEVSPIRYLMCKDRRFPIKGIHNQPIIFRRFERALPERIYVYLLGNYRSANTGTVAIPYDEIVVYDFKDKNWGSDLYSVEQEVKSELRIAKVLN